MEIENAGKKEKFKQTYNAYDNIKQSEVLCLFCTSYHDIYENVYHLCCKCEVMSEMKIREIGHQMKQRRPLSSDLNSTEMHQKSEKRFESDRLIKTYDIVKLDRVDFSRIEDKPDSQ